MDSSIDLAGRFPDGPAGSSSVAGRGGRANAKQRGPRAGRNPVDPTVGYLKISNGWRACNGLERLHLAQMAKQAWRESLAPSVRVNCFKPL